jgi:serine carboxypeptidase-like clade 2
LFPEFFAKRPDLKILVVSGDADAAVPFMGTLRWMNCLDQPVVSY